MTETGAARTMLAARFAERFSVPRLSRLTARLTGLLVALMALTALVTVVAPAQAAVPTKKAWLADVHQAMVGSRRYVDEQVAAGGTQLAVNLDIDNTSLASHYDYGTAIKVVRRFARHAEAQGVAVLFNTGRVRGDGRIKAARKLLKAAGYPVTEICGRASSSVKLSPSKRACRRHFVAEGYTITANVGNRATDFTGGNYRRAFKLPNYHNQLS